MTQLLVCDWLLETRTALWEDNIESDSLSSPAPNAILLAFQKDLTSLRNLTQHIPVKRNKLFCNSDKLFNEFLFSSERFVTSISVRSHVPLDGGRGACKNPTTAGQKLAAQIRENFDHMRKR